ncbi:DctP family TRAP transporter solute-binding subunit [candidate division KSB1 bacterium]|nr:DctP family TRAP transporter solute-binding subunit [candidate division KSB1 bacterium]
MKRLCIFVLMGFTLVFWGCQSSSETVTKKRVIKLSHSHQADFDSELHMTAWIFQKWVEDHSDNLEVKIYASNALGQEREVYEAIQLGAGADCIISGTAILNNFSERIGVLDLSFLWQDFDHVHRVLDGEVGTILANELEQQGFKVLAWCDSWGYRNVVTADKEISRASDLAGLKIRTIQTPFNIAALNAMGVNATPMAFGEVYTSMQTGVLDGFEHNATVIKANKFYEVGKYMALTRHLFGPVAFVFSLKQWEQFSPQEQQILQQAATMARDVQRALAPLREREAIDFLKEQGMIIHKIDRTAFLENAVQVQNQLASERNAKDLLEKIRAAAVFDESEGL